MTDKPAITHCPHCGHRIAEPVRPAGCICDVNEWRDPDNIPEPCDEYAGDGRQCRCCEHDRECHK